MEKSSISKTLAVLRSYFWALLVLWTILVGSILSWSLFSQKNGTEGVSRGYFVLWLLGMGGISFGGQRLKQRIQERKHAEEQIENLAKIPAENPYPVLRIAKDGKLLYANDASNSFLTEWKCQQDQTVPDYWSQVVSETFASGKRRSVETKHFNKTFSFEIVPVFETNYANLYGRDITEHRQIEEDLKRQRYYLAKAQEIGSIGTWQLDIKKNELFWTDENYRIFGIPVGTELTYEIFLNCVHPDDREYVDKKWKAAINNEPYDIEHRLIVDGHIKWVREKAEIKFDKKGNCVYGIGFTQNITNRKKAEEAVRESEKKYHQLVETMNEGLSFSDENYKFTFVNPRFAEILGYPADEIIGHNITEFFDRKNKKIIKSQMTQRRHGEEKSYDIAWTRKNGQKVDTIISPRAFFDNKGNYSGSFGILTDITERRLFERQILELNKKLLKLNRQLEQTVAKRTTKLRETHKLLLEDIKKRKSLEKEIIEVSEREKKRIGQDLHDSVGQQFMGIAFMAKVLQKRITDKLPEEAAAAAEIVKYVNNAVEQARDIAKVLHPVDLSTGGLIKALHELTETTEKLFMVSCIFESDDLIEEIDDAAVTVHIYRIVQEAITNAIKHGRASKIRLRLDNDTDKSTLTIKSDGLDFPKEFEARGTGLGLQIMDHRTDIIGGTLTVRKADEGGTIVTCEFPLKKHR